jgi:hypothetical protein
MPDRDASDEEWDAWIEEQAMKDWTMTYRHKTARAETGAALRAMRRLLRIKPTYNEKELTEPFRVYRIEADLSGALQYGGQVGEMARKLIGASLSRQLGIDVESISGLLSLPAGEEISKKEGPEDLLPATEEEIADLEERMLGAGYPNREKCDESTMALFDLPLSQLTKRHVGVILESLELRRIAKEREFDDGEMREFMDSVRATMTVAFADGIEIVDILEREWWERLFGVEVEDESE